jgi:phosphatidylserine decarboxylase
MVRDCVKYVLVLTGLAVFAALLGGPVWALPEMVLALFVMYFFRDPDRTSPPGSAVIAPADGRVIDVSRVEWEGKPAWKISIFLSILDVHVNRSPVAGVIRKCAYQKGKFFMASRPEASVQNEQHTVWIESAGGTVAMKQIAGLLARRIVFYKDVGREVACGERIGLIKFGSRVDLFLPGTYRPLVQMKDRVRAGETAMAEPANGTGEMLEMVANTEVR